MAMPPTIPRRAEPRALLDRVLEWRRRGALPGLYARLPAWLRRPISRLVWRQLWRAVKFPALPPVSEPRAVDGAPVNEDRAELNMFGFFGGQFGLGESARLYASALVSSGMAVATVDLDLGLPHSRQAVAGGARPNPGADAVDLIVVNPDYLALALPAIEALGPADRFRIGCWFWELDVVPAPWRDALALVDAVMVSSRFVEEAFARVTDKPVFRVPLPLVVRPDSGLERAAFGLSTSAFVFMTSFDFHSSVHRKNPHDAIMAFRQAFPDDSDVQLVVKSSNGAHYPGLLAELVELVRGDARILVRDQTIDAAHMRSLQRCCDAFVSLHRAEGFGLGLAECMALGKPVIATRWSGNLDFMGDDNSCLVDAAPVAVRANEYPHCEGMSWAQPNVAQAAAWMRRLVDEPGLTAAIGARAADDVRSLLEPERVAAELVAGVRRALAGVGARASEVQGADA